MSAPRVPRAVRMTALGAALWSGIAAAPLTAQVPAPSTTLRPGKGAGLTMAKCSICHDITHITRTRLTRDEWDDNMKVMVARGMPIEPDERSVILDYLAANYNRDAPPPAPEAVMKQASDGPLPVQRLLSDRGCAACHALDKRLVGPSFREVAQRYKKDSAAPEQLVTKIKQGGAGVWGQIPMPPHPQVTDADIRRMVAWILQQ